MSVSTSVETPSARVEDVPLRMHRCFLFGHLAVAHALFGQAVVGRDLHHAVVREEVGARVPHVGQGQRVPALIVAHEGDGGEGRSHAAQFAVVLAFLPDGLIRLGEGFFEPGLGRFAAEHLEKGIDRHLGRHLPADVTTHAVGHGEEIGRLQGEILVDLAHPPDVGRRSGAEDGHRVTSKTVDPAWSTSPLPRRWACVIFSEFT